ncbi:MAG: 50S ribosomal protein L29 [Bacillota bacterium]
MKAKEVHELSVDELTSKLDSLKDELFKLRFQHATGQLENPARIRDVRRSIARVQTVLRERKLKQA